MLILGATRNLCWLCLRCMNVRCRCTADCGWITGHSYLTYGPLLNGATVVVFEGVRIWGLFLLRDGDASRTKPLLVLCHLIPSKPLQAWMCNSSILFSYSELVQSNYFLLLVLSGNVHMGGAGAKLSRCRTLLGDSWQVQSHHFLHCTYCNPLSHAVWWWGSYVSDLMQLNFTHPVYDAFKIFNLVSL
jgi:hypothetical protein